MTSRTHQSESRHSLVQNGSSPSIHTSSSGTGPPHAEQPEPPCETCGCSADGFVRDPGGSLWPLCIGCIDGVEGECLSLEDDGVYDEWIVQEVLIS